MIVSIGITILPVARLSRRRYCTGTRRDLVKNAVVLIVPKGKTGISSIQDLARPEVKIIAIGEPQTVPAGEYAQEVLTHFTSTTN